MAHDKRPSIYAKSADASGSGALRSPKTTEELLLPAEATPEDVLRRLRQLVAEDHIGAARRLLTEAERRFPDHSRIVLAKRVLSEGEATSNPLVQPTACAEIEWLHEPPQEARGKWVALIGSKLVGMADSAEELLVFLRSRHFEQFPVVQYVAP